MVVPAPGVLSIASRPPDWRTKPCASLRPRPVEASPLVVKNGSAARAAISGAMPVPVSAIATSDVLAGAGGGDRHRAAGLAHRVAGVGDQRPERGVEAVGIEQHLADVRRRGPPGSRLKSPASRRQGASGCQEQHVEVDRRRAEGLLAGIGQKLVHQTLARGRSRCRRCRPGA